jgi:hypothetical protein
VESSRLFDCCPEVDLDLVAKEGKAGTGFLQLRLPAALALATV